MKSPIIPLIFLLSGLTACSFPGVYKIPIAQGNIVEQKNIEQLEIGQSMSQVQFLLGTPLVTDPLSPGRWDYVYSLKQGDKIYIDTHLAIYFDKQGKVKKIDQVRNSIYNGKTLAEIKEIEAQKAKKKPAKDQAADSEKPETKS